MVEYNDDYYMRIAITEAKKAYKKGEVPVGAVIVRNGAVIAKSHNKREKANSALGHAEIIAIQKANKKLKSWRLDNCKLYVTIEPCPMCAGAVIQSRIPYVVYGAKEIKNGSHQSVINLFDQEYNHKVDVHSGICEEEASTLMKDFFKSLR